MPCRTERRPMASLNPLPSSPCAVPGGRHIHGTLGAVWPGAPYIEFTKSPEAWLVHETSWGNKAEK